MKPKQKAIFEKKAGGKDIFSAGTFPLYPEEGKTGISEFYNFPGVYFIYFDDKLIYIGKSDNDIADAITRHFQSGNYSQIKFTKKPGFSARIYLTRNGATADDLEKALIEKYKPELNRFVPGFNKKKRNALQAKINFVTNEIPAAEETPF